MAHGNLYWDINFEIADSPDAGFCERTHISVCGYDYADTFNRAQKLYNLARRDGKQVFMFSMYLRQDISGDNGNAYFTIFSKWGLRDPQKPYDFFCGIPEISMCGLRYRE